MAYRDGGRIITNGLVLSLDAADRNSYVGSGTVWRDLSGNDYNATLRNSPTFASTNGGMFTFNGVNTSMDGTVQAVNANTGSCLSMWLRIPALTFQVYSTFNSNANNGFRLQSNFSSLQYTLGAVSDYNTGITNIFNNSWTNITISTQGSSGPVYINGILRTTLTLGTQVGVVDRFKIGTNFNDSLYFNGNMASMLLYNRALSAREILENYNAQKSRFGLT